MGADRGYRSFVPGIRQDLMQIINEDSIFQEEFAADIIAPPKMVPDISGDIPEISLGETRRSGDTKRNPNGSFNEGTWGSGSQTYKTAEYGFAVRIDNVSKKINRKFFNEEVISAAVARFVLKIEREKRVADNLMSTTLFSSATEDQNAAAANWSDKTNATPIDDIIGASDKLFTKIGLEREDCSLILNRSLIKEAMRTDQIRTDSKYTINLDTATIRQSTEYLAQVLKVKEIIPVRGVYNTSGIKLAKDPAWSNVWTRSFGLLCYISSGSSWTIPGVASQPVWEEYAKDYILQSYADMHHDSTYVRSRAYRGNKFDKNYGVLITGV